MWVVGATIINGGALLGGARWCGVATLIRTAVVAVSQNAPAQISRRSLMNNHSAAE